MKKLMLLLLTLSLLLCGCGAERIEETQPTEETANMAPDFTVYNADGEAVKLSDFAGTPVVLNFWASWCGPCKNEMPDFQEAYAAYGDRIQFMMVNLTDGDRETVESASQLIADLGYTFPLFFDTQLEAATAYGVSAIPATYFIHPDGYVAAYGTGSMDLQTVETGIDLILP